MKLLNMHQVAIAVGLYDTAVGLFPLIAPASFMQLTGYTGDMTVVRLLGTAWFALGASLLVAHQSRRIVPILGVMSTVAGSALALTEIGLVVSNHIPSIFLVQAAAETIIGASWVASLLGRNGERELMSV